MRRHLFFFFFLFQKQTSTCSFCHFQEDDKFLFASREIPIRFLWRELGKFFELAPVKPESGYIHPKIYKDRRHALSL